jgi:hypothetical protein
MKLKLFTCLLTILFMVPVGVFAHGAEEEHKREMLTATLLNYSFIVSSILFVLGIILLFLIRKQLKTVNVKKQEGRLKRDKLQRWLKLSQWVSVLALLALAVSGVFALTNGTEKEDGIDFMHIHGLGFTNDGNEIYVPAHDGLKVYKNGKWGIPEGEKHDYMGFSMVDNGFYSSGHPAPGSSMKNPFGVVKSTDMGKTLQTLDLYGEVDFHGMGVGYYSHAIYVLNPEPNSRMDDAGLYYSLDETKTWTKSDMKGLEGQPSAIAVHPEKKNIVVISTNRGVYLSKDYGNSFDNIAKNTPVTSVSFTKEGKLLAGVITDKPSLMEINLESGEKKNIPIPTLSEGDAIGYIAVNPNNEKQIVFTTFEKDIYLTDNFGEKWIQIAKQGKGMNSQTTTNE